MAERIGDEPKVMGPSEKKLIVGDCQRHNNKKEKVRSEKKKEKKKMLMDTAFLVVEGGVGALASAGTTDKAEIRAKLLRETTAVGSVRGCEEIRGGTGTRTGEEDAVKVARVLVLHPEGTVDLLSDSKVVLLLPARHERLELA